MAKFETVEGDPQFGGKSCMTMKASVTSRTCSNVCTDKNIIRQGCGEKDAVGQVNNEEETFEISVRSRQRDKMAGKKVPRLDDATKYLELGSIATLIRSITCYLEEFQEQAFEKVTIHCTQSIEHLTHRRSGTPDGNMPCWAADAGVEIYCRHFVNAKNVTLSVAQGKIIRAMLDASVKVLAKLHVRSWRKM